jgi:hypothetical protein
LINKYNKGVGFAIVFIKKIKTDFILFGHQLHSFVQTFVLLGDIIRGGVDP